MNAVIIKDLGITDYKQTWQKMKSFNANRNYDTNDEIWLTEHYPVYTIGLNGKEEHLLSSTNIPIIRCDRGGQITFHGPGQIIIYPLINLKQQKLSVSKLINILENTIIQLLSKMNCEAKNDLAARGVYIKNKKIASIGLRVSKGCSYHGIALNADMDLSFFNRINPCGIKDLKMIQIKDIQPDFSVDKIKKQILQLLTKQLNYDIINLDNIGNIL